MKYFLKTLFPLLLLAVVLTGCSDGQSGSTSPEPSASQEQAAAKTTASGFESVDLDAFIEQEVAAVAEFKGQKLIRKAQPICFEAHMKRFPEEKDMTYIYTALEMSGVQPLPDVSHRMFVESPEGSIIPVYVERQAAAKLAKGLAEEQSALFMGYHVYSYDKGPAVLVVDFIPKSQAGKEGS